MPKTKKDEKDVAVAVDLSYSSPRAVYLAATTKVKIPRKFIGFIPNGEILNMVSELGLAGAKLMLNQEEDTQLDELYEEGESLSPSGGTEQEYRLRVSRGIHDEITNRGDITQFDKIKITAELGAWMKSSKVDDLVEKSQGNIEAGTSQDIEKWQTGLTFYDKVMGDGFYNGLHLLMAAPGSGKTSTMLAMMASIRKTKAASSIWYFSVETPKDLVERRMNPLKKKVKFKTGDMGDKIFAGMWTPREILEEIAENPDPNRIIIYDSPDAFAQGEGKRFVLEDIYRQLVMIKGLCKAVWVLSQPKNLQGANMSMSSVAESWAKTWFSDSVTGIEQLADPAGNEFFLKISNFKNRFGPSFGTQIYQINYVTFEYTLLDSMSYRNVISQARQDHPDHSNVDHGY